MSSSVPGAGRRGARRAVVAVRFAPATSLPASETSMGGPVRSSTADYARPEAAIYSRASWRPNTHSPTTQQEETTHGRNSDQAATG